MEKILKSNLARIYWIVFLIFNVIFMFILRNSLKINYKMIGVLFIIILAISDIFLIIKYNTVIIPYSTYQASKHKIRAVLRFVIYVVLIFLALYWFK